MSKMNSKQTGEESEPKVPEDLQKALSAAPLVEAVWKSLSPLARWDFIIWVNQAKQEETRQHRIKRTTSMLTAGKRRPCCFTIVPADLYRAMEASPKAKAKWKDLGPVARREFIGWIDSAQDLTKIRAGQACELLVAGKQHP